MNGSGLSHSRVVVCGCLDAVITILIIIYYVKRKEIHRRAAERCTMVLKNKGGLEGMVARLEPLGGITGSRFSLFFVFFSIRVLERF